jgi:hypothetical protein
MKRVWTRMLDREEKTPGTYEATRLYICIDNIEFVHEAEMQPNGDRFKP